MAKTTQAGAAYAQLKSKIFRGEMPYGTRLTELGVAESLGIGRGPARETLQRLEADRLVERPGPHCIRRVCYLEELPAEQWRWQYEMREAIDGLAARGAALHMNGADILRLRKLVAELGRCIKSKNGKARRDVSDELYSLIRSRCGNPLVAEAVERLNLSTPLFGNPKTDRQLVQRLLEVKPPVESLTEIIDAIAAHDPPQAEAAMREWLRVCGEVICECKEN